MEPVQDQQMPEKIENPRSRIISKKILLFVVITLILGIVTFFSVKHIPYTQQSVKKDQNSAPKNSTKAISDKTSIAFLRNGDIWMSDYEGQNQRKITDKGDITAYQWIPHTTKFVYYPEYPSPEKISIHIIDWKTHKEDTVYSHEEKNITRNQVDEIGPHYTAYVNVSRNGKKIAFGEDLLYPAYNGFMVYELESKKTSMYTNCGNTPIFSNDGAKIAALMWPNIVICSHPESKPEVLTNYETPGRYADTSKVGYPRGMIGWSRDNKRVYYLVSNIGAGNYTWTTINNIESVDVSAKQVKKVTDYLPGQYVEMFSFQSEKEVIYFVKTDNDVYDSSGKKVTMDITNMYGAKFDSLGYRVLTNKSFNSISLIDERITMHLSQRYDQYSSERFYNFFPDGTSVLFEKPSMMNSNDVMQQDVWQIKFRDGTSSLLLKNARNPIWIR